MNKSQPKNGNASNRRNGPAKKAQSNPRRQNNNNSGRQGFNRPPQGVDRAPSAMAKVQVSSKPYYTCRPNGDITVRHREYVKDIQGSVDFVVSGLPINPGRINLFPWLSGLSSRYESYLFDKLEFQFVTFASSTHPGTVALAVDYDASDQNPKSKLQMLNYVETVTSAAWQFCSHKSKLSNLRKQKTYYLRQKAPVGADLRVSDVGTLLIATDGHNGNGVFGSLFVEYEVTLMTPQMDDIGEGQSVSQVRSGVSNANPFATAVRGDPFFITVTSTGTTASVTTILFNQPWEGTMSVQITGVGLPPAGAILGGTSTHAPTSQLTNAAGTEMIEDLRVDADTGDTLILTINNTSFSACDLWIMQGASYP